MASTRSIRRSSFESFPSSDDNFERVVTSVNLRIGGVHFPQREAWQKGRRSAKARISQRKKSGARTKLIEEGRELRHAELHGLHKISLVPIFLHRVRICRCAALRLGHAAERVKAEARSRDCGARREC